MRVPNLHGFVVTSLAFVVAKKGVSVKGKSPPSTQEALLSISADRSCCATTAADTKGDDDMRSFVDRVVHTSESFLVHC